MALEKQLCYLANSMYSSSSATSEVGHLLCIEHSTMAELLYSVYIASMI